MLALLALLPAAFAVATNCLAAEAPAVNYAGELELDVHSDSPTSASATAARSARCCSSATRAKRCSKRQVDLRQPHVLQFEYLRFMFASYLLRDQQKDVLIIGLGGGGMVHFLRRIDPKVRIDAVEIDPRGRASWPTSTSTSAATAT